MTLERVIFRSEDLPYKFRSLILIGEESISSLGQAVFTHESIEKFSNSEGFVLLLRKE